MSEEPAPTTRFNLEAVPSGDRYAVWRESISVIFDVDRPATEPPEQFQAQISTVHLGQLLLVETASLAQGFDRTPSCIHRDGLDHCLVQVYLDGETRGAWGAREHSVARAGDVLFLDAAQTVTSRVSDFRNLTLLIPRSVLVPRLRAPERYHGRILPRESMLGQLLGAHLRTLWELAGTAPTAETQAAGLGLIDLVGCYFSGAGMVRDEEPSPAALARVGRNRVFPYCAA